MQKSMIASFVMATLLATTGVCADKSNWFVGLDYVGNSNTFTFESGSLSVDADDDSKGYKLRIGSVGNDGWRFQGYFQSEKYDKTIFDSTNDTLNEIGFDIIKGFEVTQNFVPFLQGGLGYGWMDVQGYSESSINEVSAKIGAGVIYKITPRFEILGGADLQYRSWQDITDGVITVQTSEKSTRLYAGANFHF
ncbi:outer membrane protein [Hydrogenimonas sp.]